MKQVSLDERTVRDLRFVVQWALNAVVDDFPNVTTETELKKLISQLDKKLAESEMKLKD